MQQDQQDQDFSHDDQLQPQQDQIKDVLSTASHAVLTASCPQYRIMRGDFQKRAENSRDCLDDLLAKYSGAPDENGRLREHLQAASAPSSRSAGHSSGDLDSLPPLNTSPTDTVTPLDSVSDTGAHSHPSSSRPSLSVPANWMPIQRTKDAELPKTVLWTRQDYSNRTFVRETPESTWSKPKLYLFLRSKEGLLESGDTVKLAKGATNVVKDDLLKLRHPAGRLVKALRFRRSIAYFENFHTEPLAAARRRMAQEVLCLIHDHDGWKAHQLLRIALEKEGYLTKDGHVVENLRGKRKQRADKETVKEEEGLLRL